MIDKLDRLKAALADRYTIDRILGLGGMATVYLARDLKHDRHVAIKVLLPEVAATLGSERFLREIEIAAKLTHPHILPLFDSGEADGFLYYVMPYVEGQSLRQRMARAGKVPLTDALDLTRQIASALTYAHERGVIHRDIKPENILLSGDQAIVADFGIARAVEAAGGDRLTMTGFAVGTPAYMSPEQAFATGEVDARADVYALGCVFYEMVSGQAPFEGPTPQALIAMHAADQVPTLRSRDPSLPLSVERAVERALAKNPADRFATAVDFAEALTSERVVRRVGRRWNRRRLGAVAAGVTVMAVVGLGIAVLLGGSGPPRLAVLPLSDLTHDANQEYLVAGVHEALISELAQLGIPVIARSTMVQYRDAAKPIREVAAEVGADAVIEGSVFRDGDSLEITARLYDGRSEREQWAGAYAGDLPNVTALYRGFARAIAQRVKHRLDSADEERLDRATPVNPAVYEAYLKGMYHLNQSTQTSFDSALAYFNEAVGRNPGDPLAYVGLAFAYITLGHGPAPPEDAWPRARAAAERAIRLDSTLADAWAALADIKIYYEWDWAGAERAFERANTLNPSLAMNHYHHAWYLALMGRGADAVAEHELAQKLDPLTPLHTVWIPGLYYYLGQPQRALSEARRLLQQYPDNAVVLYGLGGAATELRLYDEAIAAHRRAAEINPAWRFALGRTLAVAGRTEEARQVAAAIEADPPTSFNAVGLADIYAALGDKDRAFRWLAYEPAHGWLPWSAVNPALKSLKGDPRFDALLYDRLKLPRDGRRPG